MPMARVIVGMGVVQNRPIFTPGVENLAFSAATVRSPRQPTDGLRQLQFPVPHRLPAEEFHGASSSSEYTSQIVVYILWFPDQPFRTDHDLTEMFPLAFKTTTLIESSMTTFSARRSLPKFYGGKGHSFFSGCSTSKCQRIYIEKN